MAGRPPLCAECGCTSRLVSGSHVYPGRTDLHDLRFWLCLTCRDSWVGCKKGTETALGRPAGPELRRARRMLTELIEPLWLNAHRLAEYSGHDTTGLYQIRASARKRVHAYMAHMMGLDKDEAHAAFFDLRQCREAWRTMNGMTYPQIREWWKALNP